MPAASNTHVYTGADGSLMLSPDGEGPEREGADTVINGNGGLGLYRALSR